MPYEPQYRYIPPAGAHILTRLYDAISFIFGLGKSFKRKILTSIAIPENVVITDIGCGTGIFLEIAKSTYPHNRIIGIDPDKRALAIAENRLRKQGFKTELIQAFAESLPLPSNLVDICFTTLVLHHMPDNIKRKSLEEMNRVLKSGGKIVITDFGKTNSRLIRKILFFEKIEYVDGNFKGLITKYLQELGFYNIRIVGKKFSVIHTIIAEK